MTNKRIAILTLNVIVLTLLSFLTIIFSVLYLDTYNYGFLYKHKKIIEFFIVSFILFVVVICIIFSFNNKDIVFKISITTLVFIVIALLVLYLMKISGILDKINSIEGLRNYVASFGSSAVLIYILIQFLQVVVLPIPGFVTVLAGVYLFGPFNASIYSLIGILFGSLVGFFTGRFLGHKFVCYLFGEKTINTWLEKIKNKDKIILTFMFLFPFFPDDILCFVAGLSSMNTLYFIVMITICRLISVFTSTYSINGNIIPYNTWWGILIWIVILTATVLVTIYLYNNGDKVQNFINRKKNESNYSRRPK